MTDRASADRFYGLVGGRSPTTEEDRRQETQHMQVHAVPLPGRPAGNPR
ncbi:hypothetical protein [Austwickia chelonae]|nr:hypothetical protein [Austwickia chelonae]